VDDVQRRRRLEVLYREHAAAVHAYARRRTGAATAEDVVMEVFVIACRRLERVPGDSLPWLLGCARRVLANQRRGVQRADALTDRLISAARVADLDAGAGELVAVALAGLRSVDQEILLLRFWEDLDTSEIAAVLGCSRPAAAVRLHRARRRLAVALDQARSGSLNERPAEVAP
jgi:RNA polymerase sigma-70 factor (ECF subfamily)